MAEGEINIDNIIQRLLEGEWQQVWWLGVVVVTVAGQGDNCKEERIESGGWWRRSRWFSHIPTILTWVSLTLMKTQLLILVDWFLGYTVGGICSATQKLIWQERMSIVSS